MRSLLKTLSIWCAVCLLQPVPVQAQGPSPDKYFPEGTDMVVQVNFNQLMGSSLLKQGIPLVVKKYGENVLNMVSNFVPDDNQKKMMQDLAPELKNKVTEEAVGQVMMMAKGSVREFTVAINSKEEVNGVPQIVMTLGIPPLKSEMVEQMVPFMQASGQLEVKSEDVGGVTIYELKPQTSPMPFFAAVPEDGMMVMSISKEIITKTLKNKGKTTVDAKFKELLAQRNNTYTLFVAGVAPKKQAEDFKHFVATLTVDKDINGTVNVACVDADKAKEKAKEANESFESAVATVIGFADDHPELKPLSDSLKKVKAEVNGSNISMKLSVNGNDLLKAMKDAK